MGLHTILRDTFAGEIQDANVDPGRRKVQGDVAGVLRLLRDKRQEPSRVVVKNGVDSIFLHPSSH